MILAIVELVTQLCHMYLCYLAACELVKAPGTFSRWVMDVMWADPLLFGVCFIHFFTMPMVLMLTLQHLRMVGMNLTTNEMINLSRYEHFWEEVEGDGPGGKKRVFRNPFHKGACHRNCIDFWWNRRRSDRGPQNAGFTRPNRKAKDLAVKGVM